MLSMLCILLCNIHILASGFSFKLGSIQLCSDVVQMIVLRRLLTQKPIKYSL